jgi:Fe-S-cluster containining protein
MTAPPISKRIATLRAGDIPRKNSVGHADSVEKILAQIALLSPDEVRYQPTTPAGRVLKERVFNAPVDAVLVTPSLFRTFTCASGCTACCQKFTLDYTPSEMETLNQDREGFAVRWVQVNGKSKMVWTNDQNHNPLCDFLTVEKPGGGLGCARWPAPPLSCISAPQVQVVQMRHAHTYVLKKPYGRAWAMTPTPQCKFEEAENIEAMNLEDILAILDRYQEWARYFGIRTCIHHVRKAIQKTMRTGLVPTTGLIVWERG